mmetsp:Transcript_39830/g.102973  ORF Transcript_39830/g.102973 Transcript_39830/m.102973 type:complete len:150 (+) Transcript_39830:338-787(+)
MWLHCGVEKFGLMEQERPEDPERRGRPDAGAEEFANESSSGTEDEPSLAYAGRRRATRGSAHGRRDYTLISRKTMAEEMPLRQKRRIAQCVCASDRLQRRALRSCGQEQQSREHQRACTEVQRALHTLSRRLASARDSRVRLGVTTWLK